MFAYKCFPFFRSFSFSNAKVWRYPGNSFLSNGKSGSLPSYLLAIRPRDQTSVLGKSRWPPWKLLIVNWMALKKRKKKQQNIHSAKIKAFLALWNISLNCKSLCYSDMLYSQHKEITREESTHSSWKEQLHKQWKEGSTVPLELTGVFSLLWKGTLSTLSTFQPLHPCSHIVSSSLHFCPCNVSSIFLLICSVPLPFLTSTSHPNSSPCKLQEKLNSNGENKSPLKISILLHIWTTANAIEPQFSSRF